MLGRMRARNRPIAAAAGLVVAGAIVARFATLDQQSFTSDETVTVRLVEMSFGDMLGELPDSERTPPLYYLMAWLWGQVGGTGEVGLRAPSAVFGSLTIAVAFLAARRLLGQAGAVITALLVAVNPLLFWYSQEARAYALYVLLAGTSVLYFLRTLQGAGPSDGRGWAASSAAALGTHYFAIFLVLPQAVWLVLRRRVGPLEVAVPALTAAVLFPLAIAQGAGEGQFDEGEHGDRLLAVLKQLLVGLELDTSAEVLLKAAAVVAVLLAGAAWWRAQASERTGIQVAATLAACCLIPPVVLAAVGTDYFNARNVLAVVVPLAIALGGAFTVRRAQPLGAVGGGLLGAAGVASIVLTLTSTFPQREDWRGLARALGDASEALVVTPADGKPYDRYPLDVYLDEVALFPDEGGCIDEVAVAALPIRAGRKVTWSAIGPRHAQAPPVDGFRLVDSQVNETFVLFRYQAAVPRRLSPQELLRLRRDDDEHGAVLLLGGDAPTCS
jgi:4-amino-4-deoxy-L-arabinose transferase-like glycosyltransferase